MNTHYSKLSKSKTRREVLGKIACMGIGSLGMGMYDFSAIPSTPTVEWNAHIFSQDTEKYPIHPQAFYKPDMSVHPKDPLEAYLKRLDLEKIDKAVIVQPEPYGDDHRLIIDCLNKEPNRLKGTSLFYPKDPEAANKLANLVKVAPNIVATRFHAHRGKESYLDSFKDLGVRALWKKAVDLGLIIELHIGPNYAAQAGKLIKEFSGCKVLIDHLAEPHMGSSVEFADVLDLANFPNVYMKLSGIGHFAKDEPYFESAISFTSRVIIEFGVDRIIWGGGSPKIVDIHMAKYALSDRVKVKGGNIVKLLNWNT